MILTALGLDCGSSNFAYSVAKGRILDGQFVYKIVENGKLQNTVKTIHASDVVEQAKAFQKEVRAIAKQHAVQLVIAERFQARGTMTGNLGELVNIMLGLLIGLHYPTEFVTASQWKNRWNDALDPKKEYKKGNKPLDQFYKVCATEPHQVDASAIALYGIQRKLEIKKHFAFLAEDQGVQRFGVRIAKSSVEQLIRRKKQYADLPFG